ncbi:MAG: amidohydrolase family protein [Methylobacteriaceae bacterium]|nr:amidohydrolase family protein [Methylobacteriaceae bacterium]
MREAFPSIREAPACPAPAPSLDRPTRYTIPPGGVDTHAHVIGAPPAYPFVSPRSYTPPPAPLEAYLAMLDATGMAYGVLIQVSVHGTDNRLLLEALRSEPARLRGVAVIPLGLPDRELAALKEAGIVGLRLNVLYGGGIGFDALEAYGALAREMGWHLQFLVDARDLPPLAGRLSRLPVPYVVDHMGHVPTSAGIEDPGFRTLVDLVRDGAWVKLQGAFRTSVEGPPYRDTIPFARALAEAAPERCLWGSDWPHVANWGPMPKVGDLLDLLADWVPDETRRRRLFVDNPHRLYGFPPSPARGAG